ncbi:MAG TPA: glycosyltransferase [Methylocella sp.]|nr:glycosyltransferase [Methylocella sp.]
MEIIVLDNGLISKGEHSYHLAVKLTQGLTHRGLRCRIFGARRMKREIVEELGAQPHFRHSLYDSCGFSRLEKFGHAAADLFRSSKPAGALRSERRNRQVLNRSFEADLAHLPTDVWDKDNLVIIPAISQHQIFGLTRHLWHRPEDQWPRILCTLMFEPSWTPWGARARLGDSYYREAFLQAAPFLDSTLTFTVENDSMRTLYKAAYGIDPKILPLPFEGAPPKRRTEGVLRVGYFGYSKRDKGFHLLPEAIALCQNQGLQVEFIVQIQHENWEPHVIEAERRLRRLAGVEFLTGVLPADDYADWTGRTDIVLLPYDPIAFGAARGSGIFIESVVAGRPIIAAKGTFAGSAVERGEAEGETFEPYTSEALAEAIARLIGRWPLSSAQAAVKAEHFARQHNGEAYIDLLLALGAR